MMLALRTAMQPPIKVALVRGVAVLVTPWRPAYLPLRFLFPPTSLAVMGSLVAKQLFNVVLREAVKFAAVHRHSNGWLDLLLPDPAEQSLRVNPDALCGLPY